MRLRARWNRGAPRCRDLQRGDRVAVYWWHSCGRCRCCLSGEEESCLEGLAKMQATGLTRQRRLRSVGQRAGRLSSCPCLPEIEFAAAAPFGLRRLDGLCSADQRGLCGRAAAWPSWAWAAWGTLGLQIARAMGAEVVALTSSESKQEIATRLGAHHVLFATGRDFRQAIAGSGRRADVAVSTTMDFQAMRDVMDGLAPQGNARLGQL
jgi:Zn-dependent alcohol dehydrogenase